MICHTFLANQVGVVEAAGDVVRADDCRELARITGALINGKKVADVVLNLTRVPSVTGSICGFLVSTCAKAKEAGVSLSLIVPAQSIVDSILRLTNIHLLIPIYSSLTMFYSTLSNRCKVPAA